MALVAKSLLVGKRKLTAMRREMPKIIRAIDPKDIQKVEQIIKDNKVQIVDFKFTDLLGLWQHFSIPVSELLNYRSLESSIWVDGIGFDGSSIRGFQEIHESDMMLIPDPKTAVVDPVCSVATLSLICNVYDPVTGLPYTRDPRYIAEKAESYLIETGIATASFWGPEAEFFIFDDIRYDQTENCGYYFIDSKEGDWNTGRNEEPNLGYKPRYKEGYFPVPPHDSMQDLRSEIVLTMQRAGIEVEVHHHEVATAGQNEIDMRFTTLTKMADQLFLYKYIIKNVAKKHGKTATFMPKPLFMDNGSGMHVHQSLWKDEIPLFYDEKGYGQISQLAKWYIGGLLKHANSLMALCAPTTNSYKRLVPGFEAPVNLVYSMRNRSAAVRIPVYNENPRTKRIEFRPPDPLCNPYLAFAAMLLAGIDGIKSKIDPGSPVDVNLYELSSDEKEVIPNVPKSLDSALGALEKDYKYLLQGDVFTEDVMQTWIKYKREKEVDAIRLRPHPHEFYLYFDA